MTSRDLNSPADHDPGDGREPGNSSDAAAKSRRIEQLEFELAHQVKLVEELDCVVADHSQQLLLQQRTIQRLVDEVKALKRRPALGESTSLEDEKPPHY